MKTFHYIALALTALLLVTSCAIDEMWSDVEPADEQKVLTFKPKFEDFETVTKAIGDGSKVDKLLVQVYEENRETPVFSEDYSRDDWNKVQIAFYYGKTYKVYFWAYDSYGKAYKISQTGLKGGVTVTYPESNDGLAFNALEHLDAFYAVTDVNLSEGNTMDVKLKRPFAQVNLVADKAELLAAQATKVEFKIKVAASFVPGATPDTSTEKTFSFVSDNNFKNNEEIETGKAYLGTTYLFVPASGKLTGEVKLFAGDNELKNAQNIEIPLASNKRTNLVFTGIQPSTPDWNDENVELPEPSDGWIHISTPEQLAALLITGTTAETNVHVCNDIDMSGMPEKLWSDIATSSFASLTIDGGKYDGHVVGGTLVEGSSYMIKKFSAPAFLANATNLTVKNLILQEVQITSTTGHVGTLVNELKGSSTFTNVSVTGSSVVTEVEEKAAGGIVGYIERVAPTTRSEELIVSFEGCKVENTLANGAEWAGKFVGLLNGYDYRETLSFDSACSASNVTLLKGADTFSGRYTEGNEGEWLEINDYSLFNDFLGEESNNRGTILYGANQFVPMWDGVKKAKSLLTADPAYDGWSSGTVIYSAFDLAYLQGLATTKGTYYLLTDIDLGGDGLDGNVGKIDKDRNMEECGDDDAVFNPINYIPYLNGVKKDKINTAQAELTESDNYTIYNCKVVLNKHDDIGAGFIKQATGTTNHYNINLKRAYVYNHHDEALPTQNYWEDDNGSGNAYAGTFVATTGGTYNISNVNVSYGHVFALCKIGGVIGRVGGNLNMSNCSVDNHIVENYEANIINWYPMAMPVSSFIVYVNEWWYTQGECGGLIGFVKSPSALIDNCKVTNTDLKCYGQPDKEVQAGVHNANSWTSIEDAGSNPSQGAYISGKTIIAGRHVNQFIGDVVSARTESQANSGSSNYTVTIKNYFVNGNSYNGQAAPTNLSITQSETTNKTPTKIDDPYRHYYKYTSTTRTSGSGWSKKTYYTHTLHYCNCIGSAYYVGVDVKYSILGYTIIDKHVKECAGTLIFNETGGTPVTVTEAIGNGNDVAWTGGNFSL